MRYKQQLLLCGLVTLYVCQPALVQAEVYLTKSEALSLVCGNSQVEYQPKPVTESLLERLSQDKLDLLDKKQVHFFKCSQPTGLTHYAIIDSEIGKHLPMTYIVGLSTTGSITHTELMVFREKYGSGVKARKFMQQFEGTSLDSNFSIAGDIKHVSGATFSSKGIARGAKKATILWNWFYNFKPEAK